LVEINNSSRNEIVSISNHKCPRGETYARQEVISPVRVLTTTVRILSRDSDHPLMPVQTAGPIPKELLGKAMKELSRVVLKPPVRYGDTVVSNILRTGVDVKATFEVLE
jgi:CxxC motif-containing protein